MCNDFRFFASLRFAAFRMTGEGRFVQDGRVNCWAASGMAGEGRFVQDGRVNCCAAFGMTYCAKFFESAGDLGIRCQ